MKGKSYSIPFGMMLKKHYCTKCGSRLEKERTHRVVSKDDRDYYKYHERGTFPRSDYDVYDWQLNCSQCGTKISYNEQCIMNKIQKKQGHTVLSSSEIKHDYKEIKEKHKKSVFQRTVLLPMILAAIGFVFALITNSNKDPEQLKGAVIVYLVLAVIWEVRAVLDYKGGKYMGRTRLYSYEEEAELKKLYAYSSNNKDMIAISDKCYCFYCRESFESGEVTDFSDGGKSALCPRCGIDSVIPDSIDEDIDENVISKMNEYWF